MRIFYSEKVHMENCFIVLKIHQIFLFEENEKEYSRFILSCIMFLYLYQRSSSTNQKSCPDKGEYSVTVTPNRGD
jgi:hypothetical protein